MLIHSHRELSYLPAHQVLWKEERLLRDQESQRRDSMKEERRGDFQQLTTRANYHNTQTCLLGGIGLALPRSFTYLLIDSEGSPYRFYRTDTLLTGVIRVIPYLSKAKSGRKVRPLSTYLMVGGPDTRARASQRECFKPKI